MVADQRPELLDGDLLSPTLELLLWGVKHPSELQWLDAWPEQNWTQALVTLQLLGAIDERAMVTEHGRAIARAGTDIRIASMLLRAACVGWSVLACELAAWLTEGMRDGEHLGIDVERYWHIESTHAVRREKERLSLWLERVKLDVTPLSHSFNRSEKLAILLAWAFPERVAMKRSATLDQADDGSYRMSNGRGCRIETNHEQFRHLLIVVVDADDSGADARVRLAAPLSEQAFLFACASHITKQSRVFWDTEQERIRTVEYDMFLQLQWKHRSVAYVDEHHIISIWQDIFRQKGLDLLHWDKKSVQLLGRMRALRSLQLTFAENEMLLPLLDDEALTGGVGDWLGAALGTCRNISDVRKLNVYEHLRQRLDYRQSRLLDEWMPTHWKVPSGSNIAIDYGQHDAPVLAVRLQELFGLQQTPAIAGGRLKLSLHLLSPAGRPVQITSDLVSFWTNTYPEVRKELRGRYPKHVWPDNPLEAAATARAKPKQR
jgi:ATP-dependent helicase HrpB